MNIGNNFISTCDNKKDITTSFDNFNNNISYPYLNNNEFNKPKLIYNNISDKTTIDILVEYAIMIESIDRDIEKLKSPEYTLPN